MSTIKSISIPLFNVLNSSKYLFRASVSFSHARIRTLSFKLFFFFNIVRSFVRLSVHSSDRTLLVFLNFSSHSLFSHPFFPTFLLSYFFAFVRSFVRALARSLARSFVRSLFRSLARSLARSFVRTCFLLLPLPLSHSLISFLNNVNLL